MLYLGPRSGTPGDALTRCYRNVGEYSIYHRKNAAANGKGVVVKIIQQSYQPQGKYTPAMLRELRKERGCGSRRKLERARAHQERQVDVPEAAE